MLVPLVQKFISPIISSHHSFPESIFTPYQGLYGDFSFPFSFTRTKMVKLLNWAVVILETKMENREQLWILISDGKTIMLNRYKKLSINSPLKYLESFLTEYSTECKDKWVIFDQEGEVKKKLPSRIFSENLIIRFYLIVMMLCFKMVQLNNLIA